MGYLSDPRGVLGHMDRLAPLLSEAEARHGLLVAADLQAASIGPSQVRRWLASGRLVRLGRGVYRVGGAPSTVDGRILAGVLVHGTRCWAAHRTAAWIWDLPGYGPPGRVEVLREAERSNQRQPAWVHRTTRMLHHHETVVRSIPVTTLARTLFDLGGRIRPERLDRLVEAGLRSGACTVGSLFRVMADLGGRGRPGTVAMRTVLDRRGIGYVPTESELDHLGRSVVRSIPGIDWQVELGDDRGYIRRVDGLHRAAGLVIEWDGAQFHDTDQQRELDVAGDRRLEAMGLTVRRYRWGDVIERPAMLREEVRALVARRGRAA